MQWKREFDYLEKKKQVEAIMSYLVMNSLWLRRNWLQVLIEKKKWEEKNPYLTVSLNSYSTFLPTELPIQHHHVYLKGFFIHQGWPMKFMPETIISY